MLVGEKSSVEIQSFHKSVNISKLSLYSGVETLLNTTREVRGQKRQMDHSKSYIALDHMIEEGWLVTGISEANFDLALRKLEQAGHITLTEHQVLLLRFEGKKLVKANHREDPPLQLPFHE